MKKKKAKAKRIHLNEALPRVLCRQEDFDRYVGRRVTEFRESRGLTQTALAIEIGIRQPQLSRVECGGRELKLREASKLVHKFKVSCEDFLGLHLWK